MGTLFKVLCAHSPGLQPAGFCMPAPYTISKVLADDRIVHGFFGREGGRSMGDLASNNMSINAGDNPDLVVSNRSSAAYAMGEHGDQRPRGLPPDTLDHGRSR